MFIRMLIIGVCTFWLFMNGALLRLWVSPGGSAILSIPIEHVGKQVFTHEQMSDLSIYQGNRPVGGLTLQPRRFDSRQTYLVDFSGNLLLILPFLEQQPFNWHGSLEMNQEFQVRRFRIHLDARLPQVAIDLDIDPRAKEAVYTIGQDGMEPHSGTVPLTREGLTALVTELGLDPQVLQALLSGMQGGSGASGVSLETRQAQIEIHGERVQAFKVQLRQESTT
ncbi:MAG TPA: hypothetical protein VNQ90_18230, partial [Chthoniobacteraceae bacterium]|nr:hypothetical protein [Chthoniobacteraceae bacterium]